MHRRIASLVIAAALVLGLTACSDNPSEPTGASPVTPEVVSTETEPTAEASVEDTTTASTSPEVTDETQGPDPSLQACLDISNRLAIASAEMAEILNAAENHDVQATVDVYTELVDALGEIAETTSLPDLKDAALAAQTDFAAIRDGLKRVYIDDDMSGLSELTEATVSMQTTYTAMLSLCGP